MNFPSTEFDTALAALCHGTATDTEIGELHAVLRDNESARDAYLWQVEVHAHLGLMARTPASVPDYLVALNARPPVRRLNPTKWVAAAIFVALGSVAVWMLWNAMRPRQAENVANVSPEPIEARRDHPDVAAMAGVYKETVRFAYALNAPVIVGTGQVDPLDLGARIPYSQGGHTLHIWDWSKSPVSRVMKDTRLWPHEVFALSPDGKQLVWANGTILDLASEARSKIDLGGEFYLGSAGGQMERIQQLQFTPDGRRLAVQVLNITLTRSSHPLRKQDFDTTAVTQLVEFPSGQLVCEFPAGLSHAFTQDGKRALTGLPMREPKQQIVELSTRTGKVVRTLEPRLKGFAYAMCLSPADDRLAVFDSEGELLVWDVVTGKLQQRIPFRGNSGVFLRIAPDGQKLAASEGQKLVVFDLATGAIVATIPQLIDGSAMIHWSADSRTITTVKRPYLEGKGEPDLYNVIPAVQHFKLDDYLQK
jgi:hypothetical protein